MTAHFPFQAHFLAPESPPPPSVALSFSSTPSSSPTTTSALQVLSDSTLTPEPGPSGPRDFVKGVVGSQATYDPLAPRTDDKKGDGRKQNRVEK